MVIKGKRIAKWMNTTEDLDTRACDRLVYSASLNIVEKIFIN